jgi:plasmid maintenance system antidote protein VapI
MKIAEKISERLKFKDDFEKVDFLRDTFQLDLLHQLTETTGCRKTDIANKLKVSNSFVTQLFSGDKKMSFLHLASLVYYFDLELKFELNQKAKCKLKYFRDYKDLNESNFINAAELSTKYKIGNQKEDPDKKAI